MINELFERMTADISPLVIQLHRTRTALYDLLDQEKERAAKITPANRNEDQVLAQIRKNLTGVRTAFAKAEAALEKAKADHYSYIAMANLLAAYVHAGKDTSAIEQAIAQTLKKTQPQQQKELEIGIFTVLETRPGKKPNVVQANCRDAKDRDTVIYGRDSVGNLLAQSVGKKVQVQYRKLEHGLHAVTVRQAS